MALTRKCEKETPIVKATVNRRMAIGRQGGRPLSPPKMTARCQRLFLLKNLDGGEQMGSKGKETKNAKVGRHESSHGDIDKKQFAKELQRLQVELVHLQEWVRTQGLRVVVIFEGRDASGKGGAIKAVTAALNPRVVKVVALAKPSDRERTQWYFQRYVAHLPAAGEILLLDRSWYNRAGVERVMGFCSDNEYEEFLRTCPEFERMLIRSGIILIKYWFSVSDEVQEKRFRDRLEDPAKRWKFSDMDLYSRSRWVEYSKAKDVMFAYTDTKHSPWYVVNGDHKRRARLNLISHLLGQIPYQPLELAPVELPPINSEGYVRPPRHEQTYIPERY